MNQFGVAAVGSTLFQAGGDIVVRTSDHSVSSWSPPARRSDLAALVDQPSALLNAAHQVVEFTGREAERAELTAWRDSPHGLSVLWLHGPGGQGKTRLAFRFAADTLTGGWHVLTAAPTGTDHALSGAAGVLLVVDYADRWRLSALGSVVEEIALSASGPVRVLLVARSTGLWSGVRGDLRARPALDVHATALELPPLAEAPDDRERAFDHAKTSFAPLFGVDDPSAIRPPGPLDSGSVLSLHMAALVAVDAHARDVTPSTDLSGYLLDREESLWHKLHETSSSFTTPRLMRRATFVACLTGAVPYDVARTALAKFTPDPDQVVDDHAVCYPTATPEQNLQPLLPDRLAEDYLARLLPGGDDEARWAVPTLRRLLKRRKSAPRHTAHALTYLAAASDRHPHVAKHLEDLLRRDPQLAIDAGSPTMVALVHLDTEVLTSIAVLLPDSRNSGVEIGAHAIADTLARSLTDVDPLALARARADVGDRAMVAGLVPQAIQAYSEAIPVFRMSATEPADRAALVFALLGLTTMRVLEGTADDTHLIVEAQAIVADLVRLDRKEYGPLAGMPLLIMASLAMLSGDRGRAAALYREVDAISDDHGDPGHLMMLADGLRGLGFQLYLENRPSEALPPLERSVALYRDLTDYVGSEQAAAIGMLSSCYLELGRTAEADALTDEALDLARTAARINPTGSRELLAFTLTNRAIDLANTGRSTEATALAEECLDFVRNQVSESQPTIPVLTNSLACLARVLSQARQWDRVWPLLDEASTSLGQFRGAVLRGFGEDVVDLLAGLARWLDEAERIPESVVVALRNVEVSRHLLKNGAADESRLADALDACAGVLVKVDNVADALPLATESVAIRGDLPTGNPGADRATALALRLLAICHIRFGNSESALQPLEQALALLRPLGDLPGLALVIRALWNAYLLYGRADQAAGRAEEWLALIPPENDLGNHLMLLTYQARTLAELGEHDKGIALADKALALAEASGSDLPGLVSTALRSAAYARVSAGRDLAAALDLSSRSVVMAEDLAAARPRFEGYLASVREEHASAVAVVAAKDRPDRTR
ncbi:hypothetical protein [Umezawaea sp. NPDC059074]|uniref:hypothetical protein n=1 Tax=Umezawaea sp. NPDC059074 TaxID=3346716 RepID=UPI00369C0CE0